MGPWSPLALAEAVEVVLPGAAVGYHVLAETRLWGSSRDAERQCDCRVGCREGKRGTVNSEKGVR